MKESIRLNKYIAQRHGCTRKEADALIRQGRVAVNGRIESGMGIKLDPGHVRVTLDGNPLEATRSFYILYNRPRNTSAEDVVSFFLSKGFDIDVACLHLSQADCGLELVTDDLELSSGARTVSKGHPPFVYHVFLSQAISEESQRALVRDNPSLQELVSIEGSQGMQLGIGSTFSRGAEILSVLQDGGLVVDYVDRVICRGLTKKNLPRSFWRALTPRELGFLRM